SVTPEPIASTSARLDGSLLSGSAAAHSQISRLLTPRPLRKCCITIHVIKPTIPYAKASAQSREAGPPMANAIDATIPTHSTITASPIMAWSSVGAGGSFSDHGSKRCGKRARKFCQAAAATSREKTTPAAAKCQFLVMTPIAKISAPTVAAYRLPAGNGCDSPDSDTALIIVTDRIAMLRAKNSHPI